MIGVFVEWTPGRANSAGYVIDGNGCHIWVGVRDRQGYGRVGGKAIGTKFAHRVRYEREVGPIPEGAYLDHYVCNNGHGGCCNPLHCRPVSPRENVLRSERTFVSHQLAQTHCLHGHELAGDNLYEWRGQRKCRACGTLRARAYRAKKREAENAAL